MSTKPAQLVSKQKAYFNHATRLIGVRACSTEAVARRDVVRPHNRKVPASKETLVLKSWRQRERPCGATGTVHQGRRRPVKDPDRGICRYIAVLKIGLHDPARFRVRVDYGVHAAVILHRCCEGLTDGLPQGPPYR